VTGSVTAAILSYDKGSFFVSHRDTEKVPGMFATLVLTLPSQLEGGELVVRHKDRQVRLELKCDEPSEIAFAAFYADCIHEVLPVTADAEQRWCSISFARVRAPSPSRQHTKPRRPRSQPCSGLGPQPRTACTDSKSGRQDGEIDAALNNTSPAKIVWPLEHAYTPAELAFDKLKGADAAVTSPCSAYGKVARRSTAAAIAAAIADPGTMQMRAMMTTNSR